MNYYEMVKKAPADKVLWTDEKNTYCYGEILKQSEDLADRLNTKAKEVIGIYSENPLFQLIAFLACSKQGQIPVILHPGLKETDIETIAEENRIRYLLSEQGLCKKQDGSAKRNLLCKQEDSVPLKKEWCMAALTSGSNGTPKLLYRTYHSWAGFFDTQNKVFQINSDTRLFFQGSLSFTGNLNTVLSVLYESASVVTYKRYHPGKWLSLINRYSVNSIYMVPVKLRSLCLKASEPIPQVRSVFAGSQHIDKSWSDKLLRTFVNAEITLYYGAGELSYVTCTPIKELEKKPFSVGKPFCGIDVFIKDGEIYVNSDFLADNITKPATVHDRGTIDSSGDLLFYGRGEDIVNRGGVQVNIISLENKINSMEGIQSAAVTAVESDSKGEELILFVILDDGFSIEQMRKKLRTDLLNHEMPKSIIEVGKFVWNDSGKIDKKKMRKLIGKNQLKYID